MRVGSDPVERALQLTHWHVFSALLAVKAINDGSAYPETIVNAGEEANFDIAITNLLTELTSAGTYYTAIWALV